MSNFTVVYNFFITNLPLAFPSKTKIPNAYSLLDNNNQFLRDGYGLKNNGSSLNAQAGGFLHKTYSVLVPLTKEVRRLESDETTIDTVTKDIEDDASLMQEYFQNIYREDSNCINWPEELLLLQQGSTSPVTFIAGDKATFATLEVEFAATVTIDFNISP